MDGAAAVEADADSTVADDVLLVEGSSWTGTTTTLPDSVEAVVGAGIVVMGAVSL